MRRITRSFPSYTVEFNIRYPIQVEDHWRVQPLGGYLYEINSVVPNRDRQMKTLVCERVNEAEGTVDNAMLAWCCIKAGCNREGKDFDYSLMDFVDHVDADEIESLVTAVILLFGGDKKQDDKGDDAKNVV